MVLFTNQQNSENAVFVGGVTSALNNSFKIVFYRKAFHTKGIDISNEQERKLYDEGCRHGTSGLFRSIRTNTRMQRTA